MSRQASFRSLTMSLARLLRNSTKASESIKTSLASASACFNCNISFEIGVTKQPSATPLRSSLKTNSGCHNSPQSLNVLETEASACGLLDDYLYKRSCRASTSKHNWLTYFFIRFSSAQSCTWIWLSVAATAYVGSHFWPVACRGPCPQSYFQVRLSWVQSSLVWSSTKYFSAISAKKSALGLTSDFLPRTGSSRISSLTEPWTGRCFDLLYNYMKRDRHGIVFRAAPGEGLLLQVGISFTGSIGYRAPLCPFSPVARFLASPANVFVVID